MANRFHALERGRASLFLLVGIVLVAAVVVAAVVVVKGLSRIQSVKVPVHMQGPKPDTELAGFRASLQRRLDKLERRYDKHRPGVTEPALEQDSLILVIESEFPAVRAGLAVMDTMPVGPAMTAMKGPLNRRYKKLVSAVSRFVKTVLRSEGPEADSLDAEMRRLLDDL
jgi:predicted transcriptional regulator